MQRLFKKRFEGFKLLWGNREETRFISARLSLAMTRSKTMDITTWVRVVNSLAAKRTGSQKELTLYRGLMAELYISWKSASGELCPMKP